MNMLKILSIAKGRKIKSVLLCIGLALVRISTKSIEYLLKMVFDKVTHNRKKILYNRSTMQIKKYIFI